MHTCRRTGTDDVAIKVLYCGICHSDLHTIKNEWKDTIYPSVPGYPNYTRVSCIVSHRLMYTAASV